MNTNMNVNMNEDQLWKYVELNTKPSYQARRLDDGKKANDVANKGLKINEIAVRYGKEYHGFSIKAVEFIKPILTDLRVGKAIKKLAEGNIQDAVAVLKIQPEVMEGGIGILYGILVKWLNNNEIPIPVEYEKKAINIKSESLLNWINSHNYSPIQGKFEIVDVGHNDITTIVPESWNGSIFNNADELHNKMNKLDWRKGKPPVSFCCIYAMSIKKTKTWEEPSEAISYLDVKIGISIFPTNFKLNSQITFFKSHTAYKSWIKKLSKDCKVISAGLINGTPGTKILIACDINKIIMVKPKWVKKRNVGFLVSALQKLIRRGKACSGVLREVLEELWKSPNYNLPEQQFLRVSACRQLTWRLFITIIEDVKPYADPNTNDADYLSMMDLACLATLANVYPDAMFTKQIFDRILKTALLVQHNDDRESKWDLHNIKDARLNESIFEIDTNNPILLSFKMLNYYMPSRYGDFMMITRAFNYINKKIIDVHPEFKLSPLSNFTINKLLTFANKKAGTSGILAAHDPAPHPSMLILLQGSLPFIPYDYDKHTTKMLSGFIWNFSSSINVRSDLTKKYQLIKDNKELDEIFKSMLSIQRTYINPNKFVLPKNINEKHNESTVYISKKNNQIVDKLVSRTGFLLLFGHKQSVSYNKRRYDVIVAGDVKRPCKIKSISKTESTYLEGIERFDGELGYVEYLTKNKIFIDTPTPPVGYNWIWSNNKKKVQLGVKLIHSNNKTLVNKLEFYVDNYKLEPFDSSPILEGHPTIKYSELPPIYYNIIKQSLYISNNTTNIYDSYEINILMRKISKLNLPIYNWIDLALKSDLEPKVWKYALVKLLIGDEIICGPVDGSGNKLHDSIDYLYEGVVWRIFNMLSMLYPKVIKIKTELNFNIDTKVADYSDLVNNLRLLAFPPNTHKIIKKLHRIILRTTLWEHQLKSSNKIYDNIINLGRRGSGDASNVGSGKTLTALSVCLRLYNYNISKHNYSSKGFLILLPTTYLYNTWIDEIKKHTEGFDIITQNANGSLESNNNKMDGDEIENSDPDIKYNSIVISTLGRVREHPLNNPWIFVVIDECLSVQNKNALQTAQALQQIITAEYGCLLLSATFFRARFDKLFYMLKMLRSNLPENKNYLDCILSETIISYQPTKVREWITNINRVKLSSAHQKEYMLLMNEDIDSKKLYISLNAFLYDNFDYVKAFADIVKKAESNGRRCLIYGRSKQQADDMASRIKNVSRFPDLSGRHIAISITEGTYGLNVLTFLNCICLTIPSPDIVPQIKGRLDRPNQKANKLYLEYLLIANTIDEASLFRLEIANSFFNNYILPISDYYDLAVGRKTQSELNKQLKLNK